MDRMDLRIAYFSVKIYSAFSAISLRTLRLKALSQSSQRTATENAEKIVA